MIIKYDDSYVYIPGVTDCLDPVLTLEESKAGSLKFTLLPTSDMYGNLDKLKVKVKVFDDSGALLFKGRVLSSSINFYKENEIVCEGKMACLNDSIFRPGEYSGTVTGFLEYVLNNHNRQVSNDQKILKGTVSDSLDENDYIHRSWDSHTSTWELLKTRLLDETGGLFRIRYEANGDYLDYLAEDDLDNVSSQKVELGSNLLDLTQFVDASSTYTACIPVGGKIITVTYEEVEYTVEDPPEWEESKYYKLSSGDYISISGETEFNTLVSQGASIYVIESETDTGLTTDITSIDDQDRDPPKNRGTDYILANNDRTSAFGLIYAPVELTTWDDVLVPLNLYNKACDWLDNQGVMLSSEVSISFADLSKFGVNVSAIKLYDRVWVISEFHNVNATYMVKRITLNLDAPETSSISIGDTGLCLTEMKSKGGSGGQGEAGPPGKSAYDSAVDGGYEGTEEQFNEDIAGVRDKTSYEYVTNKISQAQTSIIDTAEEYARTLVAGYTTTTDFETYKQTITNQFSQTIEGFTFNFNELSEQLTSVGNRVTQQESYIRLDNGVIVIGRNTSPVTARFTNNALEFLYNGTKVAEFTNERLWVKNISTDNQVALYDQWALRQGKYINNIGCNLNVLWIGG